MDTSDEEDKNYDIVENFIQNNESTSRYTCFSPKYINSEKKAFESIKLSLEQNLIIFACEGYTNYGYFRSLNKHIYMIEIYLGSMYAYCLIE